MKTLQIFFMVVAIWQLLCIFTSALAATLPTLPPYIDIMDFLDRARMGLVEYNDTHLDVKVDFPDSGPFERILYRDDISIMIAKSVNDTHRVVKPYHFHRFQLNPQIDGYRVHCRYMRNWIQVRNAQWIQTYKVATNILAYFRQRPDQQGNHIDLVCYLVDAANQTEADCLLRLVTEPNGLPFPLKETVPRRFNSSKLESGSSDLSKKHFHVLTGEYCSKVHLLLPDQHLGIETSSSSTTFADISTFSTATTPKQRKQKNHTVEILLAGIIVGFLYALSIVLLCCHRQNKYNRFLNEKTRDDDDQADHCCIDSSLTNDTAEDEL